MRTRPNLPAALFLLGTLAACQSAPAPAPAGLSEKDVSDIKATVDRWVNDFVTNQRDSVANLMTADLVMLPPNTKPLEGRDAAMGYLKAYPPIAQFTVTTAEVVGLGDLAYVRGTYSIDVTLPAGPAHEEGTFLEIHRKQSDGSWPYARLIWHATAPPAAPAPSPPAALP